LGGLEQVMKLCKTMTPAASQTFPRQSQSALFFALTVKTRTIANP